MKILVTSLPDLKKIHPQRYHHILKYLAQKHEITVLSVNAWWLEEKRDHYLEECVNNLDFVYLTEKKISPVLQEISILHQFEQLDKNYNFDKYNLHLNFNSLIAGYYVSKRLRSKKIPTVFDIADDLPGMIKSSPQIPYLLRSIGYYFGSYMFDKCINSSDRNTLVTEALLHAYAFPSSTSKLIPNGVDTDLFYSLSGTNKTQLGISQDDFVLGFVGFLGEWISMSSIFRSIKRLKNKFKLKMLIVGGGTKMDELKNLTKIHEIEKNVIFTGDVSYFDVPQYISFMDVCLLPFDNGSVSQGSLPIKIFEYMACEKPVISTPLSGVKDAVGSLVLYANNPDDIENHILNLYYNKDLRVQMGKRGRDFVKSNYSWNNICCNFEKFLIEAVERGVHSNEGMSYRSF
jgi:glycosyltransferase involved in cell wall biosynthesis